MDESPQVQAGSGSNAAPTRIVMHFQTLKKKAQPPSDFMNLDKALDRLGIRKFSPTWGMSPIWRKAPFLYETKSKRFYKYTLNKTKDGYRLTKHGFKSSLSRNELKQCNQIYGSVRRALSEAQTSRIVMAAKLFHDGIIQDITEEQRGIWATQMRSIFYTGYARELSGGRSRKFRVLIDRASFECWLERSSEETSITPLTAPPEERQHSARKTPSSTLLEQIAAALANRANERGYMLLRDPLSKLVREVLAAEGYDLSDRRFKKAIWNKTQLARASKGGRRRRGNRDAFETDAAALGAIVQQQVRRPNEIGPKLITEDKAQ